MHRELQRHKGVTLRLLWLEYRTVHPNGYQYSRSCDRYRAWRRHLDMVLRQVYRAGEKAFVDYAGPKFEVVDRSTGEVCDAMVFVGVLGASNYTFLDVTWSRALPDWVMSHVLPFEFWGGVPELVIPDNEKAGVRKASRYEPDLNPTYQELATHYGTTVLPARPRSPQTGVSLRSQARGGTTSSKSSTTAMPAVARCSPAKSPSSTGTMSAAIPPSATPSSTVSSTMPTASPSRADR